MASRKTSRVDFVHVGLAKTASTFLQEQVFPAHPQLSVVSIPRHRRIGAKALLDTLAFAEPGWFDAAAWHVSLEALLARVGEAEGKKRGISDENLSGHMVTGAGAFWVADRLAELFGPVKTVLVLRHPLSYVGSMYNQYVRTGGTLPLSRLWNDPSLFPGRLNVTQKLDYRRLVAHYRRRFDPENVLVLPFELLCRDQAAFLGRIWQFLGVESIELGAKERAANPSWPALLIALVRLGNGLGLPWRRTVRWAGRLRRLPGVRRLRGSGGITRQRLCRAAGEFAELLRDENYRIWDGDLARFNYTFED